MGLDRFVYFEQRVPTHDEVHRILENFFGGAASIDVVRGRWFIVLPGRNSATFKGIDGASPILQARFDDQPDAATREIEVILQTSNPELPHSLDVLTRRVDDFTNGIAERLAREFARFYKGKLDDD